MDICQHGYFYHLSSYNFILEESPKKKISIDCPIKH